MICNCQVTYIDPCNDVQLSVTNIDLCNDVQLSVTYIDLCNDMQLSILSLDDFHLSSSITTFRQVRSN